MADPVPGSREELYLYLDQLAGRPIRTRAELEAYLNELKAREEPAQARSPERRWTVVKHALLGVGLVIAVLQYYLIDVYVQILALQRLQVFNTVQPVLVLHRSALEFLSLFC